MRTLVVGIPLPHASYDNYSLLSAPSFVDYLQLIALPEAVSGAIDDIVSGASEHFTFTNQPVVNGPTSPSAFGLADLLAMRRRETEWLLARGGTVVCFGYPDVAHTGIAGIEHWRRYDWLPAPQGFRYEEHLLPGFGKPGAMLAQEGHAFAPYVETFGPRLAYQTVIDEITAGFGEYGRVFIRSHGGVAIGAELAVADGRVIILPPLVRFESERSQLADTLFECLEAFRGPALTRHEIRKEIA